MADFNWHLHLPTPGELYSESVGSAITTVIAHLVEAHLLNGGRAGVLVVQDREHQARGAELLSFPASRDWLTRRDKVMDSVAGALTTRRPRSARMYYEALQAVPESFDGLLFLHNAPAAVSLVRRLRPRANPVVYVHNDLFRAWGPFERRRMLRQSHAIVFVSEFLRRRFVMTAGEDARLRAVLNGAPDDFLAIPPRPVTSPVRITFIGKVTEHKGVDVLARACSVLWAEGIDVVLRIVGRHLLAPWGDLSPFEQQLREQLAPHAKRVEFTGFVARPDVPRVLEDTDILVVPSNWAEPCSLTLPEGLVSGRACVASCVGGLPEVAGSAAILVRPGDVDDLARVLRRLATDEEARVRAAAAARERAPALTWSARYDQLIDQLAIGDG